MQFYYVDLNRPGLQSAATKLLLQAPFMRFKAAAQCEQISKAILSALGDSRNEYRALAETYGKKNEDGTVIFNDKGEFVVEDGKNEDFQTAWKQFMGRTFKIKWGQIHAGDLLKCEFTPEDILALMPFIEGLEDYVSEFEQKFDAQVEAKNSNELAHAPATVHQPKIADSES